MKCKYCEAELEANSSVCPACGKDNLKDNLKGLKITALVLVCLVMLVLLAGLVCYGVTGSFTPWIDSGSSTGETNPSTEATLSAEDEEFLAKMDDVVATMGEHSMTNRQLQMYYWMIATSYDAQELDLSGDLNEQIYDEATGQTFHEYFLEEAVKTWQKITLMADAAEAAGYELAADYVAYLEDMESELDMYASYYGLSSAEELVQAQFGIGCTYETYYEYAKDYYYGGLYWADMAEELDVTDDEINAYFAEHEKELAEGNNPSITKDFGNMYDVRSIRFTIEEDTDAAWAQSLKQAEDVMEQWEQGDMTEERFIELVREFSMDTSTNENGGLYADCYAGSLAYVDVRHILIMPDEENEDTDAAWAEALTEAEDILDQWLTGEKTEESFGSLANEHSDDNDGEVTNGGIYTDIYMGQMVAEFEDWCFDPSRQPGDYGIVKTTYGYHIMYFVHSDREFDDWAADETRAAGDYAIVKTDEGYQLVYYVSGEPAWYRYSRYGVQQEKADVMFDALVAENDYTLDADKAVIGELG